MLLLRAKPALRVSIRAAGSMTFSGLHLHGEKEKMGCRFDKCETGLSHLRG